MPSPSPIQSPTSPRQVLAEHFKTIGELPIRGGWGYTKADACIIDKDDPAVNPAIPFAGMNLQYLFVEKRIYEELIISRPKGEQFNGIQWKLLTQELVPDGARVFDRLVFAITALSDADWDELNAEWGDPDWHASNTFGVAAHHHKREERMLRIEREFWFDITSFFGK
jgi:hypothetical protein